jgi:membrane protease YdiL (CAAX protease family)
MIWLQHGLVLLILVAGPVWDHYEFKRLKATTDPAAKVRFYRKIFVAQWLLSGVVLLAVGRSIFEAPEKFAWMGPLWSKTIGGGLAIGLGLGLLAPFMVVRSEQGRAAVRKAFGKLGFFVPTQAGQFGWFGAICVTAGVCEEWIFRGFLFRYFGQTPWHWGLAAAFVLSAVLFGVNHFYQGWKGIISTGLMGAGFGLLYLWTGSLLGPMIVHALVDLRGLALLMVVHRGKVDDDGFPTAAKAG